MEAETRRNLEVIWLMKRLTPDHKTIARFRHDNADALKKVFREFVKLCDKLGFFQISSLVHKLSIYAAPLRVASREGMGGYLF